MAEKPIETANPDGAASKVQKTRSPNYPLLSLEKALQRTKTLYDQSKVYYVPIAVAQKLWGYKEFSGAGDQVVAAIKAYGLIDLQGTGKSRQVRVSETARRVILGAADTPDILKKAALAPAIHAELWQRYDEGLPPNEVVRHYLILDRPGARFNEDVADGVIDRFRETIAFAKLTPADIITSGETPSKEENGGAGKNPPDVQERQHRGRLPRGGGMADSKSREEVFVVPEGGEIVLQFPAHLSKATFDDLQDWLKITVRKIGRLVRDEPAAVDESV